MDYRQRLAIATTPFQVRVRDSNFMRYDNVGGTSETYPR
jgi:hypothetical protein